MILRAIYKLVFYKIMGWKIKGDFPDDRKMIVAVAPHTSWKDVPIGLFTRVLLKKRIRFIAKKELFKPPFGWFLRALGGAGVERSKSTNMVQATADYIKKREDFLVAITPEGTRKKVTKFKTGFYYIAKLADIPILPVGFDFANKTVIIFPKFEVTDDIEADLDYLWKLYLPVKGYYPERSTGGGNS